MNRTMKIKRLVFAALCLALCLLLPFLTGQIPQIGRALSPMHIPVLLCGFICGAPFGAIVGAIAPLLRSVLFSTPPLFPDAVCMVFELAAYGFVSGLMYKLLPKKFPFVYVSLITAMLAGRAVWGLARFTVAGLTNTEFPFAAFLAGAFTTAVPGIICHIVLIPLLVIALKKAHVAFNE